MQLVLDVDGNGTNYTGLDLGTMTINATQTQYAGFSPNLQTGLCDYQEISSN
jgi:hypothetical protein